MNPSPKTIRITPPSDPVAPVRRAVASATTPHTTRIAPTDASTARRRNVDLPQCLSRSGGSSASGRSTSPRRGLPRRLRPPCSGIDLRLSRSLSDRLRLVDARLPSGWLWCCGRNRCFARQRAAAFSAASCSASLRRASSSNCSRSQGGGSKVLLRFAPRWRVEVEVLVAHSSSCASLPVRARCRGTERPSRAAG